MSDDSLPRRRVLAGLTAIGALPLAGCSTTTIGESDATESDGDTMGARGPAPTVPEAALGDVDWEAFETLPIEETTRIDAPLGQTIAITARGNSRLYEDRTLRSRIREGTLGQLDTPMRVFFAGKAVLDPNVFGMPTGVGEKEVLEEVRSSVEASYREELTAMGLEGFEQVDAETVTVGTGESVSVRRYASTYPYDGFEMPLTDEQSLRIEGGDLAFESLLGLWVHDERILMAGGSYPGENVATEQRIAVTDLIDADLAIDFGLTPAAYRDELDDLVRAVR